MFKLLIGTILIFGIILLLTGAIGFRFLRMLFGFGNKTPTQRKDDPTRTYTQTDNNDKIFGDHEGEYVEYEEIDEKSED